MHLLIVSSLALLLSSCTGLEKSEQKKIKDSNRITETIHRTHDETTFEIQTPLLGEKPIYPWESKRIGNQLRITKEFFRCKGNSSFQPILIKGAQESSVYIKDCDGIHSHSLSIKEGKESIYPILIDLLNYVQKQLEKKVIITSGHQCPQHHLYSSISHKPSNSKHQIGAEVDFYIEGMEEIPEEVLTILMNYYSELEDPTIYGKTAQSSTHFSNKEIAVRIIPTHEGRDLDNDHPYPYLTIEVKWDRLTKKAVSYSWHKAHHNTYKY